MLVCALLAACCLCPFCQSNWSQKQSHSHSTNRSFIPQAHAIIPLHTSRQTATFCRTVQVTSHCSSKIIIIWMTGDESSKDGRSMWVCHRSMCRGVGNMGCWFHVGNIHPILVFLVVFSGDLPQHDTSFCSLLLTFFTPLFLHVPQPWSTLSCIMHTALQN